MDEPFNQEKISEIRTLINEKFSQNPSPHDRFYENESSQHLEPKFENYSQRNEFSRDADRILYSKAFRRLEHKAQVYSNKKGDHYRTRLTHTLEVTQIARSISRNLGLNEHLTEAIALGHDIGHTPFGHAGEEVLDNIMRGKDDLGGKLDFLIDYGGFKHNFNCLKILEIVEKREKYVGLNLTWQCLDGILKHTRVIKEGKKWDLNRFVREVSNYEPFISYNYFNDESKPSYEYPLTLEGQVVAISDEIAQREHDLDDSLRDCDLFRVEEIFKEIKSMLIDINSNINSKHHGYNLFKSFYSKIFEFDKIENHMQWKELTSVIISYFIIDVTTNTMGKINEYDDFKNVILIENNHKYILESIVGFSEIGKKMNDKIEEFIEKRIINSFNVNRFDGKGKFILRQLFKAYYENPRQMPRKQLIILTKNIEKLIQTFPILKNEIKLIPIDVNQLYDINENNVDLKNLSKLFDLLKLNIDFNVDKSEKHYNENDLECINFIYNEIGFNINGIINGKYTHDLFLQESFEKIFDYCNKKNISDLDKYGKCSEIFIFCKALLELHYIYLTTICEYISQMTDDYAEKEYKELYLSN